MLDRYQNECCEDHIVHADAVALVAGRTPGEDELAAMAELFKVFGDSTRIKILYALFEAELDLEHGDVVEIGEELSSGGPPHAAGAAGRF